MALQGGDCLRDVQRHRRAYHDGVELGPIEHLLVVVVRLIGAQIGLGEIQPVQVGVAHGVHAHGVEGFPGAE